MLRIQHDREIVGADHHRAGWKYALSCLRPLESPDGLLLEDFVDRAFGWEPISKPYTEPWIGVFHKPPGWPDWLGNPDRCNTPARLMASELFRASQPTLRLAITLSTYLADWLSPRLSVPVVATKHPALPAEQTFCESAYRQNLSPAVVQIGYVQRNLRAIYQLRCPKRFRKIRIRIDSPSANRYEQQVREYWQRIGPRPEYGSVHELSRLPDETYDELLTRNVVFLELFDASANNTTLDCIMRSTPLLVNRLPALEEYLGREYPLFYEHLDQATELLRDDRILAAHHYLQSLDKRPFSGERFRKDVAASLDA